MDILESLLPLLFLGPIILGLFFGAALPPFFYGKRTSLAIVLNLAGFLLYVLPAFVISLFMSLNHIKDTPTLLDRMQALGLTLGAFTAVEGITLLLRYQFRQKRRNKQG